MPVPIRCRRSSARRAMREQGHARPRAVARDVRNQPAIRDTLVMNRQRAEPPLLINAASES